MRVDRLRLTDYRGIGHAEVRFAPTGVTIVEGDNEVGKTSLTEALDLVLTVRDDSRKEAIRNLQPHGRDVGPEVEVELTTGPYRLVLRKRWLRRPETVLEVHEPEREVHTGREAHERAQELLRSTADTDLWAALRLEQGADAGLVAFGVPSLGRALDRAAGGTAGRDREDDLWERIVAERARYWTPTGRPSAERERLTARLAEAEDGVRQVEAELRQLEAHVDEMARLEAEAADLAPRQRDLDSQVEQLQAQQAEVEALRREDVGERPADELLALVSEHVELGLVDVDESALGIERVVADRRAVPQVGDLALRVEQLVLHALALRLGTAPVLVGSLHGAGRQPHGNHEQDHGGQGRDRHAVGRVVPSRALAGQAQPADADRDDERRRDEAPGEGSARPGGAQELQERAFRMQRPHGEGEARERQGGREGHLRQAPEEGRGRGAVDRVEDVDQRHERDER